MFFPNNKTTCWRHCEIVSPPNDLVFAYSADLFKPFVCWCLVPFVYFGSILACPRSACSCNSLFCSPIRWVRNHQIKMFVGQSAHIFQTINVVDFAFWVHFESVLWWLRMPMCQLRGYIRARLPPNGLFCLLLIYILQ